MKDIIELYDDMSGDFDDELKQRTAQEIAYDNAILAELRKGGSIKQALKIAGEQHPEEALQYDDNTIHDIQAHYEYQLNHERIKARAKQLKSMMKSGRTRTGRTRL